VHSAVSLMGGFFDWVIGGSSSSSARNGFKTTDDGKVPEKPSSTLNPNAKVFTPQLNPNAKVFTPAKREEQLRVEEELGRGVDASPATFGDERVSPTSCESQAVVEESGTCSANVTPSSSERATPECVTPVMEEPQIKTTCTRLCTPWASNGVKRTLGNVDETDDESFEGDVLTESDDSSDDDDDDCDELTLKRNSEICDSVKEG
jgi:hypothetical protein